VKGRRTPGVLPVAVLISGRGSNLQALIDACADPAFPAEIVLVISNVPGAAGLDRATAAGIATAIIDHRDFVQRDDFEAALTAALAKAGAEIVCMAGFMRIVGAPFVTRWAGRLLNIHPSLLPSFPGLHTHARALAAGVKVHGCTVHMVRPELDDGPIVGQGAVAVLPGDDEASLAARVLAVEHRLYPRCLRLVAEGRVTVTGRLATLPEGGGEAETVLINPKG
jgi:phosphoribosylglycinamide formyltransferase 1